MVSVKAHRPWERDAIMLSGRKPWNEKGSFKIQNIVSRIYGLFQQRLAKKNLVTGLVDKKVTGVVISIIVEECRSRKLLEGSET